MTVDLQRPVVVYYQHDVEPSNDHPSGFLRGAQFIVRSPAAADEHHPDGTILMYADGGDYDQRAARTYATKVANGSIEPETEQEPSVTPPESTETNESSEDGSADPDPDPDASAAKSEAKRK